MRQKAYLERDAEGGILGGFGIAQDITTRKRLEQELVRKEEQARLLLEQAPAAIFEVDLGGPRLTSVNRFLCEHTGYSREELLGMNPLALLADEDRARFSDRVSRRLAGEALSPSTECGFLTKLGEERRAALNITPTFHDGSLSGVFIVAQDVTERARTEEALRRSERRYRELVDNAGSAIIRWTRDGTITFFNEYAERLFGWRNDEVIGRHVGVLVPPRDTSGADLSDLVDAIVRHPARYRNNLNENVCRDGRRVWMTWTNSPLYDENGVVSEILAVGSDVTERRQVEQALHESEERYARLYEAQRRVAATLQENLVNPLPLLVGLDLAALSLPATRPELIGGDFHDVFEIADGHVVALIGDVMGKGVKAAGLTETVRSAVRALALVTTSPAQILTLVNRLLLSTPSEQFVSAIVMVLDPVVGRGRFASAGHPPPVIAAGRETRFVEPPYGVPLGTLESSYEEREVELSPGEILLLYTDGVTEGYRDGELFGEERLLDAVRGAEGLDPQALVERLRDSVIGFAGALRDDVDIVALRLTRQ